MTTEGSQLDLAQNSTEMASPLRTPAADGEIMLGRGIDYDEMPYVRSIVRESAKSDYKLSTMILEIVRSMPFQINRKAEKGS